MRKTFLFTVAVAAALAAAADVKILEPAADATVPLLTDAQKAYVSMDAEARRAKFADAQFRKSGMGLPAEKVPGEEKAREAYWPKTVRLAWEAKDGVEYRVSVLSAKNGKSVFEGTAKGGEIFIDNLEVATAYEWTVQGGGDVGRGRFRTEVMTPRLVRFPGVPNVRDLGGWIGLGGRRVKQGMVFRSAGLNDNARKVFYTVDELRNLGKTEELKKAAEKAQKRLDQLRAWQADPKTMDRKDIEYLEWCTRHPNEPVAKFLSSRIGRAKKSVKEGGSPQVEKGREPGKNRVEGEKGEYVRSRFGIRSDIDLRSDPECFGMAGSPLGDSVRWFHYSSSAYSGMQDDFGRDAFRKVFKVFLDERNYPIDFHCIAGQDRTGAVAYIIGALLGADENRLALDWETTGFWNRNPSFNHKRLYDRLVKGFTDKFPADTVRERVEKYVLSLGFSMDDISKLRSIMLEDCK